MSADEVAPERRTATRAPIELRVEYKRVNTFFSDYTRNISKGGTFIRTDKPLPIGTEFVFCLVVPKVTEPMRLVGKVVWVTPTDQATDEKPAGMGIEFQYSSDAEREQLEACVSHVMVEELGEEITASLLGHKP